jgi:hypothetical protein
MPRPREPGTRSDTITVATAEAAMLTSVFPKRTVESSLEGLARSLMALAPRLSPASRVFCSLSRLK